MAVIHLDQDTYRRLRAGDLEPERARALAQHLEEACDACEAFLSGVAPDALDGVVDAALVRVARTSPAEAGNDVEYARIRRAAFGARSTRRRSFAPRWLAAAAAVLVVGAGAAVVMRQLDATRREAARWDGMKGAGQAVPARLRFAVVGGGVEREQQVDRGHSGAVVSEDASLAFRVEVGKPAYLALLRIGSGENEVVWREHVAQPGAVDVSEGGRPAAYPLRGLRGTQRFALVASGHPLTEEDLAGAAREATGARAAREDPRRAMTLDVVEVTVR